MAVKINVIDNPEYLLPFMIRVVGDTKQPDLNVKNYVNYLEWITSGTLLRYYASDGRVFLVRIDEIDLDLYTHFPISIQESTNSYGEALRVRLGFHNTEKAHVVDRLLYRNSETTTCNHESVPFKSLFDAELHQPVRKWQW